MPYLCCHLPVLQHVTLMVCFKTGFLKYALPCVLYPQRFLSAVEKVRYETLLWTLQNFGPLRFLISAVNKNNSNSKLC